MGRPRKIQELRDARDLFDFITQSRKPLSIKEIMFNLHLKRSKAKRLLLRLALDGAVELDYATFTVKRKRIFEVE